MVKRQQWTYVLEADLKRDPITCCQTQSARARADGPDRSQASSWD